MYHRIAEPESDAWDITVTKKNFEQQLQVLNKTGRVISVNELVEDVICKTVKKNSIAITFDDGYADNYYTAKPLLEKYELPATFFIASANTGKNNEFWWDELEHLFLFTEHLPSLFLFTINGKQINFNLNKEEKLNRDIIQKHKLWKACDETPPTIRCQLFYKVWEELKPLPAEEQQQEMQLIRTWADSSTSTRADYVSMSAEQLKELKENELFEIGAHTTNHAALAFHPKDFQKNELSKNMSFLKEITGKEVTLFTYPYGNYNHETLNVVSDMHLKAAFTTEEITVKNQSKRYRLGRLQVKNWKEEDFKNKLRYWSTL